MKTEEKEHSVQKDTNKLLTEINSKLDKMNSFRHSFLSAIVYGLGYAIGFTIFAGILIGILSKVIDNVHDVPILNDIVETIQLDDALKQN